jgi:mannose-6-phosphate isomerase-like protein (cupin superfamily)
MLFSLLVLPWKECKMPNRRLHVIHILIRHMRDGQIGFLVCIHEKWSNPDGQPYLALPSKKTVTDPLAPFLQGTSLEEFVDSIMKEDLHLAEDDYALEHEIEAANVTMPSPTVGDLTDYTIYPVDVWVIPDQRETLRERVQGEWMTCEQALAHPHISPTARAVFALLVERETRLDAVYAKEPAAEGKPEAPRRLLQTVRVPTMDTLAKKWFSRNKGGVRHLPKRVLTEILDVGDRAFNLRVADPYLRYQMQGIGFTWSFFTHKDKQDLHVHSAPVVEIYGVLEGQMEIWYKPYHDRGTAAWSHRVLEAGDWVEVDALQCHIVHWRTEGQGVVFKGGPGPLAEVGKLGVKGKTSCTDKDNPCPCMKPPEVVELEKRLSGR